MEDILLIEGNLLIQQQDGAPSHIHHRKVIRISLFYKRIGNGGYRSHTRHYDNKQFIVF